MKLVYMLGKSASGKDTVYKKLREDYGEVLCPVIPYTTRPMRKGEMEGEQYHFITMEESETLERLGKVIEKRVYQTMAGPWKYMTVDDGQVKKDGAYLMIGTLESFCRVRDYYGEEAMVPVYLEVEDGLRLERAMARERMQQVPKYAEMCRRFLADEADFAEENMKKAGIRKRFENTEIEACVNEIKAYLAGYGILPR